MPFYEYECEKCKTIFEYLDFNKPAEGERTCPSCGSADVQRIITSFGHGDSCRLDRGSFG